MYKKENVYRYLFANPLYFVQNVSLLNNFVAGIVVFLVYIALFTIYVYFQIRKGYENYAWGSRSCFFHGQDKI